MTNKTFDPTKPVETVSGLSARIICTDKKSSLKRGLPIVALVTGYIRADEETTLIYSGEGICFGSATAGLNLVNIPEREVRFVNVYLREKNPTVRFGTPFKTINDKTLYAGLSTDPNTYGTIKLTFEDGKLISSEVVR